MLVVVVAAMVVVVWEENVLSLPGWRGRKKKKDLPPGGQCATVKSSLQSIHIAEVHFDFYKNKIQLRIKEPKTCRSHTAARRRDRGELRLGRGEVYLSF